MEWEDSSPLRRRNGTYRWFLSRAEPLRDSEGRVWRWFGTNTDITIQRENEQQIQLLMGELNHRAKNMLAVIQAIVVRTADKSYSESLAGRLQALSRNQDMLTRRNWAGAPVGEVIKSQLANVEDLLGKRVFLEGDFDTNLSASAAETLGLAIHELSTNATKYGALSGVGGRVHIHCAVVGGQDAQQLVIRWEERDGPAVSPPRKSGFGTVMINRNPTVSMGAKVEYGYPADGFFWRLTAPLKNVMLPA